MTIFKLLKKQFLYFNYIIEPDIKILRFEPIFFGLNKRKDEALNMLRLSWLRVTDDVRTILLKFE